MAGPDHPAAGPEEPATGPDRPVAVHAALAALAAIDETVRKARTAAPAHSPAADSGSGSGSAPGDTSARTSSEEALAALLLLRELREQLAGWEPGLIEAARDAGASWADLAHPLGVTSRQAAERRYLRVRPGNPGTTAEQRVQATRDRRAADRSVTAWAHGNAADLRRLAGQITSLDTLPTSLRHDLDQALADNNPAQLLEPLSRTHAHLAPRHPELAERVDTLTRQTTDLRNESDQRRSASPPL
ncbi:type III effector protein [Streptomyces sp. NPDC006339]|uniref:type III effector protein n=1 Tax=Streptomyces sp. NPDC006339 TaxID=3156755 RepID=UPI0033BE54E7